MFKEKKNWEGNFHQSANHTSCWSIIPVAQHSLQGHLMNAVFTLCNEKPDFLHACCMAVLCLCFHLFSFRLSSLQGCNSWWCCLTLSCFSSSCLFLYVVLPFAWSCVVARVRRMTQSCIVLPPQTSV